MKFKPLFATIFLLSCIFQVTDSKVFSNETIQPSFQPPIEDSCRNEWPHAKKVFAMAKLFLPYCDQLSQVTMGHEVLGGFCDSTKDHQLNKTKIEEAAVNLEKFLNTCETHKLPGIQMNLGCELLEEIKPHMDVLNNEANELMHVWNMKTRATSPPSTLLSWEQERVHAREALEIAKSLLPACYQLPRRTMESAVLADFCNSVSDNVVNITKIAKATEAMEGLVNSVCIKDDGVRENSRCELLQKMTPDMEMLNNLATKLTLNWIFETNTTIQARSKVGRELAYAKQAYTILKLFPSQCDRLEPNTTEHEALSEFCNFSKSNFIHKETIKGATEATGGLIDRVCRSEVNGAQGDDSRCDLLEWMRPHMELLGKLASRLMDNWQFKPEAPALSSNPQEPQHQTIRYLQQLSSQTQILLLWIVLVNFAVLVARCMFRREMESVADALGVTVALTFCVFCFLQLLLVTFG